MALGALSGSDTRGHVIDVEEDSQTSGVYLLYC